MLQGVSSNLLGEEGGGETLKDESKSKNSLTTLICSLTYVFFFLFIFLDQTFSKYCFADTWCGGAFKKQM